MTAAHDPGVVTVAATKAEALAYVAAQPRTARFYIHAHIDGRSMADDSKYFPAAFRASMQVTRAQVERIIGDSFSASLERQGVGLRFTRHLWEGRQRYDRDTGHTRTTRPQPAVWIG